MSHDEPFYHLVFSHRLKAVYAPIPKAACTTWKSIFRGAIGLPPTTNAAVLHSRRHNGLLYADAIERAELIRILFGKTGGYFKFVIGRNPYARLASAYKDLVQSHDGKPPRGGASVERLVSLYARKHDKRPSEMADGLTFSQFVEALAVDDPALMDRHWQPQTILACSNLIPYDLYAPIEKGFDGIFDRLGYQPTSVPVLNKVSQGSFDLRPLYTDDMIETVQRIYANDFRRFRYDPDIVPQHT